MGLARHRLVLGGVMASVVLVAGACGGGGSQPSTAKGGAPGRGSIAVAADGSFTPVGTRVEGGTVTWAEAPGAAPNYIFPLYSPQVCSTANVQQFQALLYRPLYWFGNDNKAQVDFDYSIGNAPEWSADGKTVTVTLKSSYRWSDGEPVDANDVVFWMNLLKANKANWCNYTPGAFPDNVVSYAAVGSHTVRFTLDKAYNQNWFLYNELSQITPLPIAWDVTSPTAAAPTTYSASLPDHTDPGAVYRYLDGLAKDTGTYATSKVWSVVDGPFRLRAFTSTGEADFVPNPLYGGPVKPTIAEFTELPFTADQPEVNLARTGPGHLTVGWLPVDDAPQLTSLGNAGYVAEGNYAFSADYFPLNLANPTFGPVFRQQYFREAFQHLVDQRGWITAFEKGYAIPTYGLIPLNPTNSFLSPAAKSDPAPFDVAAAKQLLQSHGWEVVPDGTTTCQHPGSGPHQCGAGVPGGLGLSFGLDYASGVTFLDSEMKDLASVASRVGIRLRLTTHTAVQVFSAAVHCAPTDPSCSWTAANWGGGWVYSPDFYPTGESIVATGAAANFSNYSSATMDRLIQATTVAPPDRAQSALDAYQDYVRQQLPFVFQPDTAGNPVPGGPTLVSAHLGGFSTNAYSYITPEQYYLTK